MTGRSGRRAKGPASRRPLASADWIPQTPLILAVIVLLVFQLPWPLHTPTQSAVPGGPVRHGVAEAGVPPPAQLGPAATWRNVTTEVAPPMRQSGVMAYDPRDGYTVLFGGTQATGDLITSTGTVLTDTWTYRAGVWTPLHVPGPPDGADSGMAYDYADGYLVLYGGCGSYNCSLSSNATWTFSDGRWTQAVPAGPGPLANPLMAWDPLLGEVILWGGFHPSGNGWNTGTWAFLHGRWTNLTVSGPSPPALGTGELTYVPALGALILAGGQVAFAQGSSSAVWSFDGSWRQLATGQFTGEMQGMLAPEMSHGFGVLFGGINLTFSGQGYEWIYTVLSGTWVYDGSSWVQEPVAGPPPRAASQLAYDAADGYDLLFGGWACGIGADTSNCSIFAPFRDLNDTWAFSLGSLATTVTASVSPPAICVLGDSSCLAGASEAVVNLTIQAVLVPWGGLSTALTSPSLTFLPWAHIQLDPSSATTSCEYVAFSPTVCSANMTPLQVGLTKGFLVNWTSLPDLDSLLAGNIWTVQFGIEAAGPPYGLVPVDACTTTACTTGGSGPIAGRFSELSYGSPLGPVTANSSLPLVTVTVDPPRSSQGSSSPPTTGPPLAPGAPVPLPGPIGLPSPSPLPVPLQVALGAAVPTLSLTAALGGVLSAGFARVILQRRGVAQRVASATVNPGPPSAFDSPRENEGGFGRFE